jgi:hypothetical protein
VLVTRSPELLEAGIEDLSETGKFRLCRRADGIRFLGLDSGFAGCSVVSGDFAVARAGKA